MSIEDEILRARNTKAAWNHQVSTFWRFDKDKPITLNTFFTKFFREHRDELKDILDIGCGPGRYLLPMVKEGKRVVGVDISDQMIAAAEENLKLAGVVGKAKFMEGESKHLDFPDESFDFVLAKGSIHHNTFAGIQQSFKEIARVLRPGMFFLFQARSTNDSGLDPSKLISDMGSTVKSVKFGEEGVIQHYFTKEELGQLAEESGFEIISGPEEQVGTKDGIDKPHARWWVVYRKL